MEITITGGSDDLVEIEGCLGADEFCNSESGTIKFSGNLVAPSGVGMRIHVLYDENGPKANGCWSTALGLLDEGRPWANWPVTIEQGDRDYNVLVRIQAPEGTELIPD